MSRAVRLVLDTNVLLALFVFADRRLTPLRERLAGGEVVALADAPCLDEFRRVLAYPEFGLDARAGEAVFAAYAARALAVAPPQGARAPLPPCRDPDDQKFLELARDGGADFLVSRDRALLKLARRPQVAARFRIVSPEALVATWTG